MTKLSWTGFSKKTPQERKAVSYTHLDVYKRQLLCIPTLGLCPNTLSNQHDFIFKCHCCNCWTDYLGYLSSHPLLARWL